MLDVTLQGDAGSTPTLVLMHFLGGSGREWNEVVAELGPGVETMRIDLPGFGGSAGETGYTIAEMVDAVQQAIERAGLKRFVLVGHSMSGKLSMVLARRLQTAKELAGIILVAPSPPGPEPMTEEKRSSMIGLLGAHHEDDFARARSYISKNEERDIPAAIEERAASEVLRMNRTAWVAWLTHGSKEDWAERVGVLGLPALVVAGEKDKSLGPKTQAEVTMPHLGNGRLRVVKGSSHLIPMERPQEMAAILKEFVERLPMPAEVPDSYLALIEGERVSPRTREVLELRMEGPARLEGLLTAVQERTLRAMLARIVPQPHTAIDLAGFVLARLASGKGDGWRYDVLPEDLAAYREGLDALIEQGFEAMEADAQDEALTKLAAKKGSAEARWFEEVRGDAVSAYVAHPATLARMGYSGIGVGGAETKFKGFVTLGPNEREAWEPLSAVAEVSR